MVSSFSQAIQATGIAPPSQVIADGALHRFHVDGDRSKTENGWYVFFDDPPAGAFGCWKRNISETWNSRPSHTLTEAEKADYKAKMEAIKQQREAEQSRIHSETRERALEIWQQAQPAPESHSYLAMKAVASHGLRFSRNKLVVPLRDCDGTLHGLQFISSDGDKRFLSGSAITGHYFSIGGKPDSVLYICEGYATGASIHEVIGAPVAVAFNAGNLLPVAKVLKEKIPHVKIVVCGDNDEWTEGNPGVTKAKEAVAVVSGVLALPIFRDTTEKPTDFNDLYRLEGADEVRRQITSASLPEAPARQSIEVGGLTGEGPQPLRREIPVSDPFPMDALPGVLRGMADRISETIQPPLALIGQSILASACLAVQGHADVLIDGRRFPISEFFLTVGASGERKSATDKAVSAPHRKHERNLAEIYGANLLDYDAESAAWKKARENALKLKTQEEIKLAILDAGPEPAPPVGPSLTSEEPTYEGLVKSLAFGQPAQGIFSSEGGRFLGGHAMSRENQLKTAAGLSSLWDGEPITRTRSGDGHQVLYGRRCCAHLMLQPNIAADLFSNNLLLGQGFLARCLVAAPESTIGRRMYREQDISQTPDGNRFFSAMMSILEAPLPVKEGTRNELDPRDLSLAPDAKQLWIGFHDHVEGLMGDGRELAPIKGFSAKAAEHAARLAAVLTLIEDLHSSVISRSQMEAGIELTQFYIGEALRLFYASVDSPELILAEKCLVWAQQNAERGLVCLPGLYQKGPSGVRDKATAKKIVAILEDHGWLLRVEGGAEIDGKKRREVWRLSV